MMPMGTLMKKMPGHLRPLSTIRPPTVGPSAGAKRTGMAITAELAARSAGGKAPNEIVVPSGKSIPPPIPWMRRKTISRLRPATAGGEMRREPAEKAADREEREREDEDSLHAEAVAEVPRHRDDRRLGEDVAGDDPLDGVDRRLEIPLHRDERDIDNRRVQHRHEERERGGQRDGVFVLNLQPCVSPSDAQRDARCPMRPCSLNGGCAGFIPELSRFIGQIHASSRSRL